MGVTFPLMNKVCFIKLLLFMVTLKGRCTGVIQGLNGCFKFSFMLVVYANTGTVMSGGFYRYKPAYIKPFPIPSDMVLSKSSLEIENLVKAIEQKTKMTLLLWRIKSTSSSITSMA